MTRLTSKATEKLLMKTLEHKLEEVLLNGIQRDAQLGHFNLLAVRFSQQLLRLISRQHSEHYSCILQYCGLRGWISFIEN